MGNCEDEEGEGGGGCPEKYSYLEETALRELEQQDEVGCYVGGAGAVHIEQGGDDQEDRRRDWRPTRCDDTQHSERIMTPQKLEEYIISKNGG